MEPSYRVIYSESVRNALRDLLGRAAQRGLAQEILAAVRTIDQRPHTDPRLFGEPRLENRALKLQLRIAIEPPLVVHYPVRVVLGDNLVSKLEVHADSAHRVDPVLVSVKADGCRFHEWRITRYLLPGHGIELYWRPKDPAAKP